MTSLQPPSPSIIEPFTGKFPALLIFGPPGAGKGTVGRSLSFSGGEYHLSSGDIFRGLAPESPAGKLYHSYASQGLLVPDEVTIEIFRLYVEGLIATNRYYPQQQFLMLDGIPRTIRQVELLTEIIDVQRVIVLEVEDEQQLIARLQRRAKLEKRHDDTDEAVLRKRMEVYWEQTAEVLSAYPPNLICRFRADQRPLEVLRDVLVEMAEFLSDNFAQSQSAPG